MTPEHAFALLPKLHDFCFEKLAPRASGMTGPWDLGNLFDICKDELSKLPPEEAIDLAALNFATHLLECFEKVKAEQIRNPTQTRQE